MALEAVSFSEARAFLNLLGDGSGEWAGLPMPVDGEKLAVHPSYTFAALFKEEEDKSLPPIFNRWPCLKYRADVVVYDDPETGRRTVGFISWPNPVDLHIHTAGLSCAWEIEPEIKAAEKLRGLITPHAFKTWLLTGSFLETSKRSGVSYLFRRLRPTVAISSTSGRVRFLAALCLHPIGYYRDTWAGCMVPTDEVVAHLMLMRGDEHLFWKQANQHPAWRPEAGL